MKCSYDRIKNVESRFDVHRRFRRLIDCRRRRRDVEARRRSPASNERHREGRP